MSDIPQTSLSDRASLPSQVAVQFTRWTSVADVGYQADQIAGFPRAIASKLIAEKCAVLVVGGGILERSTALFRKVVR